MCLGLNKQTVAATVLFLFTTAASGQEVKSYKYRFDGNLNEKSILNSGHSLIINYSINELELETVEAGNAVYYRISIPGHTPIYDPGKPELPVLSRIINIPREIDYKIIISDVSYSRLHPSSKKIKGILYPAQETESKNSSQRKKDFKLDREAYSAKGILPYDTVRIEPLGTLRGKELANLIIAPVRYNPRTNSIEVISSMKIEITNIVPAEGKSASTAEESAIFTEALEKSVLNYSAGDVIPGFSDEPVKMIILTDTTYKKFLAPYIKWKTRKGFKVQVLYRGKKYAGDTYTEIKSTLTSIYNSSTPAPEYLLIIGDTKKVPYYGTGNITDMYYGEFTGNGDYIPELLIGRLPVSDTTQLKAVLNKLLQYEQYQFAPANDFTSRALISAGNDDSNSKIMNGQVYYAINNYLNSSNKLTEYHFYYPKAAAAEDSIRKIIRKGVGFINYTGHGDVTGWLDPLLKSGDIDTVTNTNMHPFIISNACQTSTFTSASALGNRMVLADKKGAAGFIGGAADTYWDEDFYWAVGNGTISSEPTYSGTGLGAYDRLFHTHGEAPTDWYTTMGQVMYAGNLAVSASTSARKKYYWEVYNLVGDPSIIPYIGKPDSFLINLPDTLPNGIKSFTLTGEPFSYIAVSRSDTLWDAAHFSASGSAELTMPGLSNDSCLIVITGQNRKPLIKTVYFGKVSGTYLNMSATEINDTRSNNNTVADYGETFFQSVKISNLGYTPGAGVYVKIASASPDIEILNDSVYIGNLAALSEVSTTDKLEIRVSQDVKDLSTASLNIYIGDSNGKKQYISDITLHAPELYLLSTRIDDSSSGNANYIAEKGETFNIVYKVRNDGSSDASGQFIINSYDSELLTFRETSIKSGTLKLNSLTEIAVESSLSDMVQNGDYLDISATLNCDPFIINNDFRFRIGLVSENFEAGSFDIFPWINSNKIPWTISSDNSYDGSFAAKSGIIGNSTTSTMLINTFYNTDDTLKFRYRVSSEASYDYFIFRINDTEVLRKSGETGWLKYSVAVKKGLNKFEFTYKKDNSTTGGSDCAWIDMIDFVTTGSLNYIRKDLKVARVVPLPVKNKYSLEPITVKLVNVGKDTINGFNLAYMINKLSPVTENFKTKVIPSGDTVTVEFKEKVNFYRYGLYSINTFAFGNNDDYLRNDTASYDFIHELTDSLIVYPNPFREEFTIYINSKYSERIMITIANSAGTRVFETTKNVTAGKNPIIVYEPWLSPGVYYITIRTNRGINTLKVVKMRK
ncbi:MAG TPA: C25 family cysteine peptidase [Bacteroidales bacterium]|nr:C25 family cysteine peptidase [Bacteroidales bacterium]